MSNRRLDIILSRKRIYQKLEDYFAERYISVPSQKNYSQVRMLFYVVFFLCKYTVVWLNFFVNKIFHKTRF